MDEEVKALRDSEVAAVLAKIDRKIGESRPRLFLELLVHSGCRIAALVPSFAIDGSLKIVLVRARLRR
jgi:hypothetical protein